MTLSQISIAIHTVISIIAIVVGAFALRDLFRAQASATWLSAFIVVAIATSATGFICPIKGVSPAVVISIVALVILAAVLLSRGRLRGSNWARWLYVGGLVASEYLLIFVGSYRRSPRYLLSKSWPRRNRSRRSLSPRASFSSPSL